VLIKDEEMSFAKVMKVHESPASLLRWLLFGASSCMNPFQSARQPLLSHAAVALRALSGACVDSVLPVVMRSSHVFASHFVSPERGLLPCRVLAKVFFAIIMSGFGIGQTAQLAPDYKKASSV
jgi:hypothetical protein